MVWRKSREPGQSKVPVIRENLSTMGGRNRGIWERNLSKEIAISPETPAGQRFPEKKRREIIFCEPGSRKVSVSIASNKLGCR